MQLVSPMILMHSRLYELGLQAIDVGGAGDCFCRSHQFYMAITTIICKSVVLEFNIILRDHPNRFVDSNTENSRHR